MYPAGCSEFPVLLKNESPITQQSTLPSPLLRQERAQIRAALPTHNFEASTYGSPADQLNKLVLSLYSSPGDTLQVLF